MCVYVLVAIIAKERVITRSPSQILQILGIMLFEKTPINQALATQYEKHSEDGDHNQLVLFDF